MIKFAEELERIKILESRMEKTQNNRERADLRREIRRRKREYASAMMFYKKATGK